MIYVLFVDSKITMEFIESKIEHENRYLQNVLAIERKVFGCTYN